MKCDRWYLVLFLSFFILSCAHGGTYPLLLRYQPTQTFPNLQQKVGATLGLAPFKDQRPDTLYIGFFSPYTGLATYFKSEPLPIEKAIQESLTRILPPCGIKPVAVPSWDGNPDSLKMTGVDSVLLIEIQKFWIEGKASIIQTNVRTSVGLLLHLGMPKDGKAYSRKLESEREMAVYSLTPEKAGEILNQMLAEILDSYFSNPY
ncbi:MAG: hypothetical protein MUO29_09030 [Desulfobacterales bacterium]|nr:hypothetical protein [Desulfobacterales bacterium]